MARLNERSAERGALRPAPATLGPLDAEQAVLGFLLEMPEAIARFAVRSEYCVEPFHAAMVQAFETLGQQGRPVSIPALVPQLRHHPAYAELGGEIYLATLAAKSPPEPGARAMLQLMEDEWLRRSVTARCARAAVEAGTAASVRALSARIRVDLEHLEAVASAPTADFATAREAGTALVAQLDEEAISGRERGLMTGLRCIDRRCRGLRPGWVIILASRPSMGKTATARAMLYGAAARNPGHAFLFYALEMDRRELTERALSAASFEANRPVPYVEMGGANLPREDRELLRGLARALPDNMHINDRSSLSVDEVRRGIWSMKRQGPVGAVVIDYLQLMERPAAAGRNDAAVIGEMTKAIKQIARETGVCIVLLSQLNRQLEGREDKRPQLADLRESGSIEQDANVVLFPYREVYYVERAEPTDQASVEHASWVQKVELVRRRMDVIAAKVRGGAIGIDRQACFIEYDHITDLEPDR